jgi:beta-galactosidase
LPVHVGHWGTFISTPQISKGAASIALEVHIENGSATSTELSIAADIFELDSDNQQSRRAVASMDPVKLAVAAHTSARANLSGTVRNPRLWSLHKPNRYVALTRLEQNGTVLDQYETPFGIRTIEFTADNGFLLNGERVPLNGVCDHHDLGALGSALNLRALERQLQLLQEMGCNAIRTSHNPPAPELLDLCDRLGLVVMDEAFDCWLRGKTKNDYHLLFADWHERDLRAMVRRDRNHPCIILWSIGNEIPEQDSAAGRKIGAELAGIVHSDDRTRPVTAACNNVQAGYNGFQKNVNVFGYNYHPGEYGKVRDANPNLPLFGSETASCISSRGEYFVPVSNDKSQGRADFQVSSYDLYAPPWATTPDTEFKGQDQFPYVAGEFVWTGFDYLGEPTPYNEDTSTMLEFTDPKEKARLQNQLNETGKIHVPSRSSYFGIIDLAGFKKDRFYLYQSRWRPDLPLAHILPHWNWPERVGQVTPVHVYTSGDEAELFLNGKSLGRKKKGPNDYRLRWDDVVYHPGEVKVIAYRHHNRWAHDIVRTTASAAKLLLGADRVTIVANGQDLSFVTVTVADEAGRLVPRSQNRVAFSLSGPGEIIAVDNGDPTSFEPFQAKEHRAFNGLCLVIIRSTSDPGSIELKATSPNLQSAALKLRAKPSP